ncbi:hypothetical protein [Polyangium sp. 15x6]|uniref:hypothetical protein n=1 Tax=Polyangium sp. 15x6 TaxID=3042687 RepID=UPI00249B4630|nr:hypothetical protein [Polyangium sp. 15x6]MDI3285976.1 hypothetical protein [Polyangium sp. 15x6]
MNPLSLREVTNGLGREFCAPVAPDVAAWFHRFFLGKTLLLECLGVMAARNAEGLALARVLIMSTALLLAETRHFERLGIFVFFLLRTTDVVLSFPYTINHAFFECALLLALLLSDRESEVPQPARVAQVGILLVFFQAGVQKLAHGHYVNGEFLALRVLFDEGDMGRRLRWMLEGTAQLGGLAPLPPLPLPRPSFIAGAEVSLPAWTWSVLRGLSNGVWIAEMGLPVLALHKASRAWAAIGLLFLESFILVLSGETSFGFTTVACLLSFFPELARWTYPAALLALTGVVVLLGR